MNVETLERYTAPIDALCIEAAHSDNEYDIGVVLAILGIHLWEAECDLGYDHQLAGEISGDCPADSRFDYWYPKFNSITPSADTFDEKVALGFALHRGVWYLRRVEMYGAEVFDPKTTSWALDF